MNNRIQIAHDFAKSINSKYIKKIILFGSVARGEDTEDSDIDILIISDFEDIIEPIISDEVLKIVLDKEEFVSAHVMSQNKLDKIKDFTFLKNIKKRGLFLDEIESLVKIAIDNYETSLMVFESGKY